jgi:exonuclease I
MWWFDERGLAPVDFKLATLCKHFGIPVHETHDALADVRLTVQLAKALRAGQLAPAMGGAA